MATICSEVGCNSANASFFAFRFPAVELPVLQHLLAALEQEHNEPVIEMIIYSAQEILSRKSGRDLYVTKPKSIVAMKNKIKKLAN